MQDLKKRIERLPKLYIDHGRPGGDEWALSFFDQNAKAHTIVGAPAELIVSQKEIIEKLTEREAKLVTGLRFYADNKNYTKIPVCLGFSQYIDTPGFGGANSSYEAQKTLAELGIETGGE